MKIGYARAYTDEQSLDLQRDTLKAAWVEWIYEGKNLRAHCRPGRTESLLVVLAGR